ncbi:MAG TPA: 16S rRNA (cytosine(1402)-N(4))-methyltransferase RsmH [Acidobacteriaceae bacterium]|nr:16S rRNA (cytosine(1402)-N(4))-methyltransferase RsmH [Terriglobia bacterium]HVC91496.1 16S rRNA (cytosine(1402)-N(4))-methyltransferase RsmH [Acidobacteriaceae bacterium]
MPVLLEEAIEYLRILPGGTYMDATLGLGGHSTAIARLLGPEGHLIAFDRDPEAIESAQARFAALRAEMNDQMPRITIHAAAFAEAASWVEPRSLDGILADFGVSSLQLDTVQRGFSFQADAPLDMRMDPRSGVTAEQVVNQVSEEDLANLIYEFGEERRSRRIARAIVRARPVTTTAQLAKVVTSSAPAIHSDRIHPATRVFQALRIYVNGELDQIASLLQQAPQLLRPAGRMVAISFHSLEDRIVKDAFRAGKTSGIWKVLTPKPVTATEEEIRKNPRARSAKLRAAERAEMPAKGGKQPVKQQDKILRRSWSGG